MQALKNVEQLAKLRADAGVSSTSDELQTRTRIAGMQATVEQYNASLNSARARLAVLTGIQAERYSPVPGGLAVEPDSLNRIDYSLIPTVMAAQNMERSAQYGVETAVSQHWPTLSLKGGRTRYESDNRAYWDDQIQLNIDAPLYQGGAVSARVRQAEGARAMASSQSIRPVLMSCKKPPSHRPTGPGRVDEWKPGSVSWKMRCAPAMSTKMNIP